MPGKRFALAITIAFVLAMGPLQAFADTYKLDKPHTQVVFSVSHLGFTHSYGKFTDYSGAFTLNHGNLAGSHVDVTIRTGSVSMDDAAWNKALMGKGYFDVEHYPVMTFKSTHVEPTGDKTAKITGNLTLLGVTKPVTLDVTLNKTGRFPFGDVYVAGLSADTAIERSDFGMTGGLPLVGDEVKIHLEVEGHRIEQPGHEFYNQ